MHHFHPHRHQSGNVVEMGEKLKIQYLAKEKPRYPSTEWPSLTNSSGRCCCYCIVLAVAGESIIKASNTPRRPRHFFFFFLQRSTSPTQAPRLLVGQLKWTVIHSVSPAKSFGKAGRSTVGKAISSNKVLRKKVRVGGHFESESSQCVRQLTAQFSPVHFVANINCSVL